MYSIPTCSLFGLSDQYAGGWRGGGFTRGRRAPRRSGPSVHSAVRSRPDLFPVNRRPSPLARQNIHHQHRASRVVQRPNKYTRAVQRPACYSATHHPLVCGASTPLVQCQQCSLVLSSVHVSVLFGEYKQPNINTIITTARSNNT